MNILSLRKRGAKVPPTIFFDHVLKKLSFALTDTRDISTSDETEADQYAKAYLAHNLVRKTVPRERADQTYKTALEGFLLRETVNKKINDTETFGYNHNRSLWHNAEVFDCDTIGSRVLDLAAAICKSALGPVPTISELMKHCEFGNGASATLSRRKAQRERKYVERLSCTRGLLPLAVKLLNGSPAWSSCHPVSTVFHVCPQGNVSIHDETNFLVVCASVLDTVPKDSDTDRIIMKEPEVNGYVQKSIGKIIRRKLRCFKHMGNSYHVDLNNSGSLNSRLARDGSIEGHVATIDAERASDSLTVSLYERLFPKDWCNLLMVARTPYTTIEGKLHRLQMMSGMGNGFTFEAESLIFYSIGLAATMLYSKTPFGELLCSVHGDDLTIPADVFSETALAYEQAGIRVNVTKSFASGKFRESCGGHWYSGYCVKPFYRKDQTGNNRGDWFWLANSLLLWLNERDEKSAIKAKLRPLVLYLRWYASSGHPLEWRASFDHNRRSGLYCATVPASRGPWFVMKSVIERTLKDKLPQEGLYLAWLQQPTRLPTIIEMLSMDKPSPVSQYARVDTEEFDGRRRFAVFRPITRTNDSF